MAATDVEREVRATVLEQLNWDDRVLSTDIKVDFDEGKVILHGHVPTYFSRMAAEENARSVIGVTTVENKLVVKHSEKFDIPDDAAIKKAIENMVRLDTRINPEDIIVEVNSGTVSLNGTVDAFWKKAVIEDYVNRARGVIDVLNKIRIVPEAEVEDEKINENVKKAFKRNSVTSNLVIDIQVNQGEVTLSGSVLSHIERHTAGNIADHTSGVTHVNNNLKLSYNTPRPDTY